jgi:hypothetical protein
MRSWYTRRTSADWNNCEGTIVFPHHHPIHSMEETAKELVSSSRQSAESTFAKSCSTYRTVEEPLERWIFGDVDRLFL